MKVYTGFYNLDNEFGGLGEGICSVHGPEGVGKTRFLKDIILYNALMNVPVAYLFNTDIIPKDKSREDYIRERKESEIKELKESGIAVDILEVSSMVEKEYKLLLLNEEKKEKTKIRNLIKDHLQDENSVIYKKVKELYEYQNFSQIADETDEIEKITDHILSKITICNIPVLREGVYEGKERIYDFFVEGGIVAIDTMSSLGTGKRGEKEKEEMMEKIWKQCKEKNALCFIVDRTEDKSRILKNGSGVNAYCNYVFEITQSDGIINITPEKVTVFNNEPLKLDLKKHPLK